MNVLSVCSFTLSTESGLLFCRAQGRTDACSGSHKQRHLGSQGGGLGVCAACSGPQQPSPVDCTAAIHPLAQCQTRCSLETH